MADEKLDNETQDEATEAVVDEADADPVEVEAEVDVVEEPPAEAEAEPVEAEVEPVAERKPITRLPKSEHARGRRQERLGSVVSAAGDKTIVVRVDTAKAHPMYKKVIRRSTRLHAHDERNEAKVGDIVRVVETRPLSKLKRWRLQEIVEAAK